MYDESNLLYESSASYDSRALKTMLDELLNNPESQATLKPKIEAVLSRHEVPRVSSSDVLQAAHSVEIIDKGAGMDPATIAMLVALTPLIKALVPLVQPFANNAADVAKKISLDVWEMVKLELLNKKHVRLSEKKDVSKKDKGKSAGA
jgi:uncharacterized alpha-E superfamily protein